jgi:predicted AAA+ superfamily ATPase
MEGLSLHPYYRNFGKRLVKSPKVYFTDVGLAAHLWGIESPEQVMRDPLWNEICNFEFSFHFLRPMPSGRRPQSR